jgi:hypothetical protein
VKAIYSFIIDGDKKFDLQTYVFLKTITASGVDPSSVIAHCTPTASAEARKIASSFGVETLTLEPFLDGKFCNKIHQLPTLIRSSADIFVLCDTDIAFMSRIDHLFSATHVRAKPVDLANPPLKLLEDLRISRKFQYSPIIVETSCDKQPTYSVNCNGGLYIIPSSLAPDIYTAWTEEAAMLQASPEVVGKYYSHIDQIGFALAMISLGYDIREIPIEYNFPVHLSVFFANMDFGTPKILHYHHLLSNDLRIIPTGNIVVDKSINAINNCVTNEFDNVFCYWDSLDQSPISSMINEFTILFEKFKVIGPGEVFYLLEKHFPNYAYLFDKISLPAAKADIARLVVLFEYGGLYVDCHCGIIDPQHTLKLMQELAAVQLIFVDRRLSQEPRSEYEHFLLNSIIFARRRVSLIFDACKQALSNLEWQYKREADRGHFPYHVGDLSGPGLITAMVMQPGSSNREVRRDYCGKIMIIKEETAPIARNQNRTYDSWSTLVGKAAKRAFIRFDMLNGKLAISY